MQDRFKSVPVMKKESYGEGVCINRVVGRRSFSCRLPPAPAAWLLVLPPAVCTCLLPT